MGCHHHPPIGGLWFTLSAASFFGATVAWWYTYLGNVPVWTNNPPGSGYLGDAAWLLRIQKRGGPDTENVGGLQYGFGVWGWCEWDAMLPTGVCHGKGSWSIPQDAPKDDPVLDLNLPDSVKSDMFGCSVILFIPAIISMILFVLHFMTIRYKDDPLPALFKYLWGSGVPKKTKDEDKDKETGCLGKLPKTSAVDNTRAKIARFISYNWIFGGIIFLLATGVTSAALGVTASGKAYYSPSEVYLATYGKGFWALIAAVFLLASGFFWLYIGGLWTRSGYRTRSDGTVYREPKTDL